MAKTAWSSSGPAASMGIGSADGAAGVSGSCAAFSLGAVLLAFDDDTMSAVWSAVPYCGDAWRVCRRGIWHERMPSAMLVRRHSLGGFRRWCCGGRIYVLTLIRRDSCRVVQRRQTAVFTALGFHSHNCANLRKKGWVFTLRGRGSRKYKNSISRGFRSKPSCKHAVFAVTPTFPETRISCDP